jgi:thiol:disulfide interchange protein DsbD
MKSTIPETRPAAARWAAALLAAALLAAAGLAGTVHAKPWWTRGVESNDNDFLPPDAAFRVGSHVAGSVLRIRWVIADGYYLYKQKMEIKAESPGLVVAEPVFPTGTIKTDPYLGTQEIFLQQVEATVPFTRLGAGAHPIQIKVTYQGCALAGLCYPPITKVLFPDSAAPDLPVESHDWEGVAIVGGGLAFLAAGLSLRKGRHLATPAA